MDEIGRDGGGGGGGFPVGGGGCRGSHLRSNTYDSLLHILSHLSPFLSQNPLPLPLHDSSLSRVEEQQNEPSSDFRDPNEDHNKDTIATDQVTEQTLLNEMDLLLQQQQQQQQQQQCPQFGINEMPNTIEEEEEGEFFGDFVIDDNLFDFSSDNPLVLEHHNIDNQDIHKPKTAVKDITLPSDLQNAEKEQGFQPNSFIANKVQHDTDNNGIASGVHKADDLPINSTHNLVFYGDLWEADDSQYMKDDVSSKTKRGPGNNAEKKARKKRKQRQKRAEMNREHGVKRLKLPPPPVQKSKAKTITCRHYCYGRCYEGDKCKFAHDVEPLTKSKPCRHFARNSCMKGDDCPFDHQLSKYPCEKFASGGCGRGDACLFSHQVPTEQCIPTLSNVSKPEMKSPSPLGNTNLSMAVNNRGCNPVQENHFSNSTGIHSPMTAEHKVTSSLQKHPMPTPKGISFLNVAKPSLLSPSTPKEGMVTANKDSRVQIRTNADQSASGTNKISVEIPKKSSAVTPKGINFLSFANGSLKSSVSSLLNMESGNRLPQSVNFGFNRDDYSKVYSHGDNSHSKSVQDRKKASENSQTSTVTSSMTLASPFVSNQSSASNSGKRAILSTLAFAADYESDIKMKSLRREQGKQQ
ncbi:PREDICTED: zinc finger CCCH domain-containing protein 65 isoform X2 [Lupinus angustifolius]|uniref:zinc finger CCCH domain-containing protein 65 isoform X2 n=1 Tax=Lupinus angustifolius TaxID=3871 RepID=UPI00092EC5F5|nr:PREDICTED: zinc finger CCCH domain-containing protein 65 isoform X2 [Lupinus angustifolius]